MKRERFFTFFMYNRNEKRMNMQKTKNVSTELKNNPSLGGWDYSFLLMLFAEQVVDGLYRVEGTEWHLHEDSRPVAHGTIP